MVDGEDGPVTQRRQSSMMDPASLKPEGSNAILVLARNSPDYPESQLVNQNRPSWASYCRSAR